jgi:hypothetical protein
MSKKHLVFSILKSAGVTHNATYDQQMELFYFLLIPIVNQFNIFEFFLLLNIKLENFLMTLISKMLTLYSNNIDFKT